MATHTALETHTIEPTTSAIGAVIWMHGLGADHHDFDSLVPAMRGNDTLPIRFVFPNAPVRPITINNQMPTRAWYDVFSLTDLRREDEAGIIASRNAIQQLIQQEMDRNIPENRIVIAGYSQGGAMALYTGLRQKQPLAGVLALSCYLPLMHLTDQEAETANSKTPIFITHGTYDATLPCFAGKMSYEIVQRTHPNAQWKEYPMGHEIISDEIQDIYRWLSRLF